MAITRFFRARQGRLSRRSNRKTNRRRCLNIEPLEERRVFATLSLDFAGVLTYTADSGAANDLSVSFANSAYTFQDRSETIQGPPLARGNGTNSVQVDSTLVRRVVVNLGDGNDRAEIQSTAHPLTINAGSGNDTLTPGQAAELRGPLTVNGQVGSDRLSYYNYVGPFRLELVRTTSTSTGGLTRTGSILDNAKLIPTGVEVDLAAGRATALAAFSGIEEVMGSRYDDRLVGNDLANVLVGNDGDDFLDGRGGKDSLFGWDGDDVMYGGEGEDYLSGGHGKDTLLGHSLDFDRDNERVEYDRFRDIFEQTDWVKDGVSHLDVDQVRPPVCTILSAMAAVAESGQSDLAERIRHLGGDRYEVTLFGGSSARKVIVEFDGTWTSNDAAPTRERDATGRPTGQMVGEFWTVLYQRAYLTYRGINWEEPDTSKWVDSSGDSSWANRTDAMRAISGLAAINHDVADLTPQAVRGFLDQGDVMNALHNGHRFAILEVFQDAAGTWKIQLYNPRALDSLNDADADGLNDGVMVLDWSEFASVFTTVCRGIRNDPL